MSVTRQNRNLQYQTRRIILNRMRSGPTVSYRIVTSTGGRKGDLLGLYRTESVPSTMVDIPVSIQVSQAPNLTYDGLRTGHSRAVMMASPLMLAETAEWLADANRQAGEADLVNRDGLGEKARNWLVYMAGQLAGESDTERTEILVRESGSWRRVERIDNVTYNPRMDLLQASIELATPTPMTVDEQSAYDVTVAEPGLNYGAPDPTVMVGWGGPARWYSEPFDPTDTGVNGDFWINTETGWVYRKAAGEWTHISEIAWTIGSQWRNGEGPPSDDLGIDRDLYLDDLTGDVYSKNLDHYEVVANIMGPTGEFLWQ